MYNLSKTFYVKPGYICRSSFIHFDDTIYKDEFQDEVYLWARSITYENGYSDVIDVGSGSGYKLIKYLSHLNTIGIDAPKTVDYLLSKYPNRKWESYIQVNYSGMCSDFIICSDVIEHVINPYVFIENILEIQNVKMYLFSTPERDIKWGREHSGPPPNIYHIREWNTKEFCLLLSKYFNIIEHRITNDNQGTQAVLCSPK